ncbi:MAG TPA: CorA family divalent cation transporter [Candidatus Paceibacterota bacterium]|nr:CorA family divalent cation transporter [Candidatus Paceibacterota bacterium]
MITRYQHENLLWIDLETPTREEIDEITREQSLHPLIGESILSPTRYTGVELYENVIYLVLHFPIFFDNHDDEKREVDFVLGKNFLITAHCGDVEPIHDFATLFESGRLAETVPLDRHAGYFFFYLIRSIYRSLIHELDGIEDRLEEVEKKVFQGGEQRMVSTLSDINRDLLNFRQATRPHRETLLLLESAGTSFFGSEFSHHLRTITGEFHKVWNTLEGHKETLRELRETNDSLLSSATTNVMKTLTILTFATSPLIIISGIFGMNTRHTPILGNLFDFWIIILLMLFSIVSVLGILIYKRWF